eukprot:UN20567
MEKHQNYSRSHISGYPARLSTSYIYETGEQSSSPPRGGQARSFA